MKLKLTEAFLPINIAIIAEITACIKTNEEKIKNTHFTFPFCFKKRKSKMGNKLENLKMSSIKRFKIDKLNQI